MPMISGITAAVSQAVAKSYEAVKKVVNEACVASCEALVKEQNCTSSPDTSCRQECDSFVQSMTTDSLGALNKQPTYITQTKGNLAGQDAAGKICKEPPLMASEEVVLEEVVEEVGDEDIVTEEQFQLNPIQATNGLGIATAAGAVAAGIKTYVVPAVVTIGRNVANIVGGVFGCILPPFPSHMTGDGEPPEA